MKKRPSFYIGIALVLVVLIPAIISIFYTPFDPDHVDATAKKLAPCLAHLFGTDNKGRDVLSRVMVGSRTSLLVGASVVLFGAFFGAIIGAITGYFGGIVDEVLMRFNDCVASFPSILPALLFVSLFGSGAGSVILVLGVLFIPSFARVMRSEFIREKEKDYVKSMKLYGANAFRISFMHILPNTKQVAFSTIAIGLNNAIIAEAALSYLGLGVQPPTSSLGRMLFDGKSHFMSSPWIVLFPGLALIFVVLGFSLIAREFENRNEGISGLSKKVIRSYIAAREEELKTLKDIYPADENSLLLVNNISIGVNENGEVLDVVKNISIKVNKGESVGIVGESGSGKSMTASAIMKLLAGRGIITGSIKLDGRDVLISDQGVNLSEVFQEPMTALNPSKKIRKHFDEVIRAHVEKAKECGVGDERIAEALSEAGITDVERILDSYPLMLSGGERQRVLIAMAILFKPKFIILDEPTTALDNEVAWQIIDRLKKISSENGMAVLFISHDLLAVEKLCERIYVLKDGEIVEEGTKEEILKNPKEDYTKELLSARDFFDNTEKKVGAESGAEDILVVEGLNVSYTKGRKNLKVINDLSFTLKKGKTLGIVGASGSGKTTILKAVANQLKYTGTIDRRAKVAEVFQDPYSSLNPSKKVGNLFKEVIYLRDRKKLGVYIDSDERRDINDEIEDACNAANLDISLINRYPDELSGGQRQRVAIAMALLSKAEIILLDEPVTALDATVSSKILKLLRKIQEDNGISYILVSHDERVIDYLSDDIINL